MCQTRVQVLSKNCEGQRRLPPHSRASIGGGAASGDMTLQSRYFDLLTDARRATIADTLTPKPAASVAKP